MRFINRVDAARQLAAKLIDLRGDPSVVVLGIPRGGVVVAYEIALALKSPLDVVLSRKLGAPNNLELAIGAVAENGSRILDDLLIAHLRVPPEYIERVTERQRLEIERRSASYRGQRKPMDVRERTAVVVDDGVATGATMIVSLRALRESGAKKLIAAVPVIAPESLSPVQKLADRVEYVAAPGLFVSVGSFYDEFNQVEDEEVRELLSKVNVEGTTGAM
jgi:putative phosphoribosyl transferase